MNLLIILILILLIPWLINAIQTFSKTVTNTQIESFKTADQKILYDISDIILAINVEIEDDEEEIRRKMTEVKEKFLKKYGKELQKLEIHMLNTDIFAEFEKDFDLILYNDWNFEYDRKIQKKKEK